MRETLPVLVPKRSLTIPKGEWFRLDPAFMGSVEAPEQKGKLHVTGLLRDRPLTATVTVEQDEVFYEAMGANLPAGKIGVTFIEDEEMGLIIAPETVPLTIALSFPDLNKRQLELLGVWMRFDAARRLYLGVSDFEERDLIKKEVSDLDIERWVRLEPTEEEAIPEASFFPQRAVVFEDMALRVGIRPKDQELEIDLEKIKASPLNALLSPKYYKVDRLIPDDTKS